MPFVWAKMDSEFWVKNCISQNVLSILNPISSPGRTVCDVLWHVHVALWHATRCPVACNTLPCGMQHVALWHATRCPVACNTLPCGMQHVALWHATCCPVACTMLPCGMQHIATCGVHIMLLLLTQPEWYLTQVSSWLCDHTPILDQRIQPVLDSLEGYQHVSAKVCVSAIY